MIRTLIFPFAGDKRGRVVRWLIVQEDATGEVLRTKVAEPTEEAFAEARRWREEAASMEKQAA